MTTPIPVETGMRSAEGRVCVCVWERHTFLGWVEVENEQQLLNVCASGVTLGAMRVKGGCHERCHFLELRHSCLKQNDVVEYVKDYSKTSRRENEPGKSYTGQSYKHTAIKISCMWQQSCRENSPLPPLLSESWVVFMFTSLPNSFPELLTLVNLKLYSCIVHVSHCYNTVSDRTTQGKKDFFWLTVWGSSPRRRGRQGDRSMGQRTASHQQLGSRGRWRLVLSSPAPFYSAETPAFGMDHHTQGGSFHSS